MPRCQSNVKHRPERASQIPPHKNTAVAAFASALSKDGSADALYLVTARTHTWAQNVVTKVRLARAVDLRRFSARRLFAYIPSQFLACAVRTKDQLPSADLVFRTGRAVVVGTHSLPQTYQAAHRLRLMLAEDGCATTFEEFWLVNMVYNKRIDMDCGIDIAAIHKNNLDRTEWVPPMFPGLKYDMLDENVKVRLFDTLAAVFMGVKRPMRVGRICNEITQLARQNPDPMLPESEKRFPYRVERKRLAFHNMTLADLQDDNKDEDASE